MTRNAIVEQRPVHGVDAFVYGLKDRARKQHCLGYGTFTVDASRLEEFRRRYSRAVRPITYMPLYVKATALAIAAHPRANAILFRSLFGRRVVRFENVDVNLPVTRDLDGRSVTFIATIRDAASKSLATIQDELAHARRGPVDGSFALQRLRRFARMPFWSARLVHWWMRWSPAFYVRNVGTCGLTTIDGGVHDAVFPIAPTSVVFGLAAPRSEPVVREGRVTAARLLRCTLMVDNFVVDGNLGARLAAEFGRLLESGSFVEEELRTAQPEEAVA